MIQLRYLKRWRKLPDYKEGQVLETVLQFRELQYRESVGAKIMEAWTDWQDVPVEEE